jgi:hypothetical protein
MNSLENLLEFLRQLDHHKIFFRLSRPRDEAIMVEPSYRRASRVEIVVPGERWEVEFFSDGHTEIEIFGPSSGVIGEANLERLWTQFSDAE